MSRIKAKKKTRNKSNLISRHRIEQRWNSECHSLRTTKTVKWSNLGKGKDYFSLMRKKKRKERCNMLKMQILWSHRSLIVSKELISNASKFWKSRRSTGKTTISRVTHPRWLTVSRDRHRVTMRTSARLWSALGSKMYSNFQYHVQSIVPLNETKAMQHYLERTILSHALSSDWSLGTKLATISLKLIITLSYKIII